MLLCEKYKDLRLKYMEMICCFCRQGFDILNLHKNITFDKKNIVKCDSTENAARNINFDS